MSEETEGLEIYSGAIGDEFPMGILIVQDGFNYDNGELKSQNFKIIDLREVIKLVESDQMAAGMDDGIN